MSQFPKVARSHEQGVQRAMFQEIPYSSSPVLQHLQRRRLARDLREQFGPAYIQNGSTLGLIAQVHADSKRVERPTILPYRPLQLEVAIYHVPENSIFSLARTQTSEIHARKRHVNQLISRPATSKPWKKASGNSNDSNRKGRN